MVGQLRPLCFLNFLDRKMLYSHSVKDLILSYERNIALTKQFTFAEGVGNMDLIGLSRERKHRTLYLSDRTMALLKMESQARSRLEKRHVGQSECADDIMNDHLSRKFNGR